MKTTGYLSHNEWLSFSDLHVRTGDKIYDYISNGKPQQIGLLIKGLAKSDMDMVHYYFLDKHSFGWERKFEGMVSTWDELKRCGLN